MQAVTYLRSSKNVTSPPYILYTVWHIIVSSFFTNLQLGEILRNFDTYILFIRLQKLIFVIEVYTIGELLYVRIINVTIAFFK